MTRVLNKYCDKVPPGAVGIMRDTKWGNPFIVGTHGDRDECVAQHRRYVFRAIRRGLDLLDLKGKDLVCCCKPKACHGDIYFILANTDKY